MSTSIEMVNCADAARLARMRSAMTLRLRPGAAPALVSVWARTSASRSRRPSAILRRSTPSRRAAARAAGVARTASTSCAGCSCTWTTLAATPAEPSRATTAPTGTVSPSETTRSRIPLSGESTVRVTLSVSSSYSGSPSRTSEPSGCSHFARVPSVMTSPSSGSVSSISLGGLTERRRPLAPRWARTPLPGHRCRELASAHRSPF